MSFSFLDTSFIDAVMFVQKNARDITNNKELEINDPFIYQLSTHIAETAPILVKKESPNIFEQLCTFSKNSEGFNLHTKLEIKMEKYHSNRELFNHEDAVEVVSHSFVLFFVYFSEIWFRLPHFNNLEISSFLHFGKSNYNQFNDNYKRYITYALFELPSSTLKEIFNSSDIISLNSLSEKIKTSSTTINNWEKEIDKKIAVVEKLKDSLDNYETAFHYIELHHGFKAMHKAKKSEQFWAKSYLIFFGFIILSLITMEFILINNPSLVGIKASEMNLIHLASIATPSLAMLLILLYFFRITLISVNSVRSQLLQLDLRLMLCQFIQNYAEGSEVLKTNNKDLFDKFEAIVFSPIVATDEKIPSTFDGVEQLSKAFEILNKKP